MRKIIGFSVQLECTITVHEELECPVGDDGIAVCSYDVPQWGFDWAASTIDPNQFPATWLVSLSYCMIFL